MKPIAYIIGVLIGLAIILAIDYAIATSNLPDWFKFVLLK